MSCISLASSISHGVILRVDALRKMVAEREHLLSAANASIRAKDEYVEDIKLRWARKSIMDVLSG